MYDLQHNVIGITGSFGSGKSLYATELAIKYCNQTRKHLIFNFPVNKDAIRNYAKARGYRWVTNCARISSVELSDSVMDIFQYRDAVFVYDEAGIFTNSRNWKSLGTEFLKNLFQIRHLNVHLLIIFQFKEQIDKQIRMVVQHWIVCKSSSVYSVKLAAPKLISRKCYHYTCEKFFRLQEDVRARGNVVLPWLWSERLYYRFLPLYGFLNFISNSLLEVRDVVTFLLSSGRKRYRFKYSKTREQMLFDIFSSTAIVGDSKVIRSVGQLPPFVSTEDYYRHTLEKTQEQKQSGTLDIFQ